MLFNQIQRIKKEEWKKDRKEKRKGIKPLLQIKLLSKEEKKSKSIYKVVFLYRAGVLKRWWTRTGRQCYFFLFFFFFLWVATQSCLPSLQVVILRNCVDQWMFGLNFDFIIIFSFDEAFNKKIFKTTDVVNVCMWPRIAVIPKGKRHTTSRY